MKHYLSIVLLLFIFTACKQAPNNEIVETTDYSKENLNITTSIYPENISKVFEAHGSIDKWNKLENLVFEIEKEGGNEKTTTNLKSRKALIETPNYNLGYNGKETWLAGKDTTAFKSKPDFYYNLMFYFYAMPFVLADDGITYTNTNALEFEGNSYPGIKVSYGDGVGLTPKDEYILYYDNNTNKMAWLGYTVTYSTQEKSNDWHFIRYSDWQNVNGFELPKTLEWYKSEGFKIGEKRSARNFVNVSVSKQAPKESLFEKK